MVDKSGFAQAVLDAIPAQVAVLNRNGTIVAVNRAWDVFASENGGAGVKTGVGANYLAVAARAVGSEAESARAAYLGLKSVLERGAPHFSLEYPCHSSSQKRWFLLEVSPLGDGSALRAVVMHHDISERKRSEEALRESEARLRMVLEAGRMGTWAWDIQANHVIWNHHQYGLFGLSYSPDPVTPDVFLARVHPDDATELRQILRDVARDGTQFDRNFRVLWPDGTTRWLAGRGQVYRDTRTLQATHMFGVNFDVTEAKLAEERLRESAALSSLQADVALSSSRSASLRQMLQACTEALVLRLDAAFARVWTFDPVHEMLELEASAGAYTHLDGAHSRVSFGKYKIGRIAEQRRPHLTNDLQHDPWISDPEWAKREGMVAFAGYPLVVADRLIGVMAVFARHPFPENTLAALASVADTIAVGTEQKRSQLRLASVLESVTDALIDIDRDGLVRSMNPAAARLLGYTEAEAVGKHVRLLVSGPFPQGRDGDLVPQLRAAQAQVIEAGRPLEARRKDGSSVPVELRVSECAIDGSKLITVALRDISRQRQLEAELQQAQKMEAIGRLAGGVAHDFNNLLTIINGYSELLLSLLPGDDPNRESIQQISDAGARAASLTRQLLAFGRRTVLEPKVLNLNTVVGEAERMLRRLIGEDIVLTTLLDPSLALVKVDPGHMGQVLLNMAVNARDAMPTGGKLIIETRNVDLDTEYTSAHPGARPGRHVRLTMTDTGCGMTPEVKARIFEPFFTTKVAGAGTGLGMPMVYGIIEQSGGFIEIESEPGVGTSIALHLPVVDERAAAGETLPPSAELRGSESILLVEDEEGVLRFARFGLQTHGYHVLPATNAEEALRLLQEDGREVDLLVTDVVLPGMSGRELAEALQRRMPRLRVLYVSGYTDDAVVRHGIQQADVAFLQKPYTPLALLAKVRQVLGTKPRES